ncbi:MAG: ABC transporter ATP-binding protein [Fimbriimonas sp.]
MIGVQGLHATFEAPGGVRVEALRGVDLQIAQGEFACVIGSNGSGKSTLLNAVAGRFTPDQGRIVIGGEDVTRLRENQRARRIGRVFQNPYHGTAPALTVAENLRLAALRGGRRHLRFGLNRAEREGYRERLAQYGMGLEDRLEAAAGTLSGGQRQALTLLMATIRRPEVLLLDEHTAALDPRAAEAIITLTRRIAAELGVTTLMVTHSMHQALECGTTTIMLHKGQIVDRWEGAARAALTPEILHRRFDQLYRVEAEG